MGKGLLRLLLLLVIMSGLLQLAPRVPLLSWVGRLPGDFRIPTGRGWINIPIGSTVVVSLLLALLIRLGVFLVR